MNFICIWSPVFPLEPEQLHGLTAALLQVAPRIAIGSGGKIWADARGLSAEPVARDLLDLLRGQGLERARAVIATTAIAAEVGARNGMSELMTIAPGEDRDFIASWPVSVLDPSKGLASLLDGIGIECCADLAALDHESVEVRFGGEGEKLWRLARADDSRRIFTSALRALPIASLDWVEYTLRDPERLVFILNSLTGSICGKLKALGQCAREMTLLLSLANRETHDHLVRPARSTASHKAWMRLIRTHLDRITLPDGVTGITVRVDAVTGEVERQGDIFDRGFATSRAAEETIAQLLDDQGAVVVTPRNTRHPLIDRRTEWVSQEPAQASARIQLRERAVKATAAPRLTLQLLPEPRRIAVKTKKRRDHQVPVEFRDRQWMPLLSAAGPDRVSGGRWSEPYAREYFRCVTDDGMLVWLYRDARDDSWYIHGWWD